MRGAAKGRLRRAGSGVTTVVAADDVLSAFINICLDWLPFFVSGYEGCDTICTSL